MVSPLVPITSVGPTIHTHIVYVCHHCVACRRRSDWGDEMATSLATSYPPNKQPPLTLAWPDAYAESRPDIVYACRRGECATEINAFSIQKHRMRHRAATPSTGLLCHQIYTRSCQRVQTPLKCTSLCMGIFRALTASQKPRSCANTKTTHIHSAQRMPSCVYVCVSGVVCCALV